MTNTPDFLTREPLPLWTGSDVLDWWLDQHHIHAGRVVHLCGGTSAIARSFALAWMRTTIRSFESCAYFDLDSSLPAGSVEDIVGAALGSSQLGPQLGDNEELGEIDSPCRVYAPQSSEDFDRELRSLIGASKGPRLVVVGGLERLLFNHFRGKMKSQNIAQMGRMVRTLLTKYHRLCQDSGQTLLLVHSQVPTAKQAQPSIPAHFWETLNLTVFANCDFGFEIKNDWRENPRADHFFLSLQAWRYNTELGAARTLGMWEGGQFKNP